MYSATAIAPVRAHVRVSSWFSKVAHPHFGKIVPTFKADYRRYHSFKSDAKNVGKMPRQFFTSVVLFVCGNVGAKMYISKLKLLAKWISHLGSHFKKTKTVYMFQRWPF